MNVHNMLSAVDEFNEGIKSKLQDVTEASGFLTQDKTIYMFCLLMLFPLAYIYRKLPANPTLKNIYGITFGVYLSYFVFGYQIYHFIGTSTLVYIITHYFPRSLIRQTTFAFAMGYIVVSHFYRIYVDYLGWSLDYTGPQMLLTIKFIIYAFDVYDMERDKKEIEQLNKADKFLVSYIVSNRLEKKFNILEYYSYMLWFNNILSGPVLTPSEHLNFVSMNQFPDRKIPSGSYVHAFKIFLYSLVIAPFVVAKGFFDLSFCLTPEFMQYNFILRALFIWIAASLVRSTYYFAWLLSESSNILSGVGFNGFDKSGKVKWNRASNVRILKIETAKTFKDVTENWNLSADKWLRNYVYLRIPNSYYAYKVYLTYLTSAVWHGLYPGYYMSFGLAGVATMMTRLIYKNVRPWFFVKDGQPSKAYNVAAILFNSFMISYCFTPFPLLAFSYSIKLYNTVYWYGHIVIAVTVIALRFIRPPMVATKKEE